MKPVFLATLFLAIAAAGGAHAQSVDLTDQVGPPGAVVDALSGRWALHEDDVDAALGPGFECDGTALVIRRYSRYILYGPEGGRERHTSRLTVLGEPPGPQTLMTDLSGVFRASGAYQIVMTRSDQMLVGLPKSAPDSSETSGLQAGSGEATETLRARALRLTKCAPPRPVG